MSTWNDAYKQEEECAWSSCGFNDGENTGKDQ